MKDFCELYYRLDSTNSTNEKVLSLSKYFHCAAAEDKIHTLALLSGRRPKRSIGTNQLKEWAAELAGISPWLFDECYDVVGDLAETIALLLPNSDSKFEASLNEIMVLLESLRNKNDDDKKTTICALWLTMNSSERFVFNKLITGGFRVGVSQKLVVKAISKSTGIHEDNISHRIMGNWEAAQVSFDDLILSENVNDSLSKPYPFYLAYALEDEPQNLGHPKDWIAEYKWDGIRGQFIFRKGELFLWSRGEELVTEKYPELHSLKYVLPDNIVIDAEILAYKDNKPMPFQSLQKRIGRIGVSKKMLLEIPVVLMAYDVLEWEGVDVRNQPIEIRKKYLEQISGLHPHLIISEEIRYTSWEELKEIRLNAPQIGSEGLMLKHKHSVYETGRKRGNWWKWKVDARTVDAVMIYAQKGHGRRANLYTDFTFAVWDGDRLVPFTKAYSGLTDKELKEVDDFVKKNTIEKFGPVRSVTPELVFEIAFEGIGLSSRHKSGVALRFPRISRWRKDKKPQEADSLETLKSLIS
jgi:DNA ligase-1